MLSARRQWRALGVVMPALLGIAPLSLVAQHAEPHAEPHAEQQSTSLFDPAIGIARNARTPHNPDYTPNPAANAVARTWDSVAGLQWMSPVQRTVARYTVPMCLGAVETLDFATRTRATYDTVSVMGRADTLSTTARTFAAACLQRWPLGAVPERDLNAFVRLALAAGNSTLAMNAVHQRLQHAPNDSAKASVLFDAVNAFTSSHPIHLAEADSLFRRVDALGPRVQLWKLLARVQYGAVLRRVGFDTTQQLAVMAPYAQGFAALPSAERDLVVAYHGQVGDSSGWEYVGDRESADQFARLPVDTIAAHRESNILRACAFMSPQECVLFASQQAALDRQDLVRRDQPVPDDVSPGFWFVHPGDTVGSPTPLRPIAGHVTLVMVITRTDGSVDPQKALIRRLYDRYAAEGLDIILVNNTRGFAWHSPPLEPKDEARVVAWYVHDVCDLPLPLVVLNTPTRKNADGIPEYLTDTLRVFGERLSDNGGPPLQSLVIDRQGRRYAWGQVALEATVRQALGLPEERLLQREHDPNAANTR